MQLSFYILSPNSFITLRSESDFENSNAKLISFLQRSNNFTKNLDKIMNLTKIVLRTNNRKNVHGEVCDRYDVICHNNVP